MGASLHELWPCLLRPLQLSFSCTSVARDEQLARPPGQVRRWEVWEFSPWWLYWQLGCHPSRTRESKLGLGRRLWSESKRWASMMSTRPQPFLPATTLDS